MKNFSQTKKLRKFVIRVRDFVNKFLSAEETISIFLLFVYKGDDDEGRNDEDNSEIADSSMNSDSESIQDAECELPIQENVQSMRDMCFHFRIFKKFYQSISECIQEENVSLNRMENNIRTRLYNLMYNKDKATIV